MWANGWTEETVQEIDKIAEAPGQPVPKAGQGRSWHERAQHEGWYDRIEGHGAEAAVPMDSRNVPEYVHNRNAQRRAETAIAKGQLPEPGRGAADIRQPRERALPRAKVRKGRGTMRDARLASSGLLPQLSGLQRRALGREAAER